MDDHHLNRLAAMAHALRPDWPSASVRTWLARNVPDRPFRQVALALAYVACEPNTSTPARLLAVPGPWWQLGHDTTQPERLTPDTRCAVCGNSRENCTRNPWAEHTFISETAHAATSAGGQMPLFDDDELLAAYDETAPAQ